MGIERKVPNFQVLSCFVEGGIVEQDRAQNGTFGVYVGWQGVGDLVVNSGHDSLLLGSRNFPVVTNSAVLESSPAVQDPRLSLAPNVVRLDSVLETHSSSSHTLPDIQMGTWRRAFSSRALARQPLPFPVLESGATARFRCAGVWLHGRSR